jgi:glutamate racemase
VKDAPIGIFDSGFGGLTVARAVMDLLPNESTTYLGDTARQPYGPKPISEVREYALDCLDHLVTQGVKALVIACNSASAAVLRDARERYDVPVVEVIVPAARKAVNTTRNGRIGVICTQSTATSRAYEDALSVAPKVEVFTAVCPRFVEFVEAGVTSGPEVTAAAEEYLAPLQDAGVDTVVLGCTHYPLLKPMLAEVLGPDVVLIDSAHETAAETATVLAERGLLAEVRAAGNGRPVHRFIASDAPDYFLRLGQRFLGSAIESVETLTLG